MPNTDERLDNRPLERATEGPDTTQKEVPDRQIDPSGLSPYLQLLLERSVLWSDSSRVSFSCRVPLWGLPSSIA